MKKLSLLFLCFLITIIIVSAQEARLIPVKKLEKDIDPDIKVTPSVLQLVSGRDAVLNYTVRIINKANKIRAAKD